MMFRYVFMFLILSFLKSDFAFAQQNPATSDSTKLYKNIESYTRRSKFTKFMYKLIFKPVPSISLKKKATKKVYKKLIQKPYSAFEGKIIRHINIVTLDPFGFSIADTIEKNQNFLIKVGNSMHVKSQRITIRNLMLIHENQTFDSLLVKESERLVRSRSFVQDVSFYVRAASKKSDSVDIYIRELDKWSIIPNFAATNSSVTLILTDRNFLGLGHEFRNGFTWYHTIGDDSYNTNYFIPNIRNTYISTNVYYGTDEFRNFTKSFAIDRQFFSPFAKWAAGVSIAQQFRNDSIFAYDSLFVPQRFKSNMQDYWAGNAIRIFKGNSENSRTTNFISSIRFLNIHYLEKPIEAIDPQHIYVNENFYLACIGINTRKYVQDKYVFKFGVTEDVPIGKVYSITGGYQVKNNTGRLYFGARVASGYYYEWGYFGTNLEYGSFFSNSKSQQGIVIAGINYFTGLKEIGKWKFRQFIKPLITIGINRLSYDSLTLHDGYGLDGFNSTTLLGTRRLVVTFQTQSYAPFNIIGFRFGPYLTYSLGMLGDSHSGFKRSKVYSSIGVGVLIKNDFLIINTFQFSISFYPLIPGNGQNIFKINSFRTTDFGFRDFEIGKPTAIIFQ